MRVWKPSLPSQAAVHPHRICCRERTGKNGTPLTGSGDEMRVITANSAKVTAGPASLPWPARRREFDRAALELTAAEAAGFAPPTMDGVMALRGVVEIVKRRTTTVGRLGLRGGARFALTATPRAEGEALAVVLGARLVRGPVSKSRLADG